MPSSSSFSPSWDVFLSFYGKDIRRNFISHLYFALDQAGISTFRDDPALEKGQEISLGLLDAIKDTNMFVVVVSENYARSSWCLNELVEILGCKKTKNQVVPVFYYVDPSDLRHQIGSFGEALEYHKKRYSVDMVDKWKSALAEIAELSGYHLKKDANENESDIVQNIVEHVASHASTKLLHLEEYLFGIDYAVEEIYQKLQMESKDVHAIGIVGMGGIGKTTIAKVFYNRYSNIFDIGCFIENVKQYSQGGSQLLLLLQQLLSELLRRKDYQVSDVKSGIRQLQHILYSKKALVVLDDLDQSSHLEWLVMLCKMFSSESRIVITTRDVNLINQLKVDISQVDVYMVNKLEQKVSLKLFSYHAFRKAMPPENFRELSASFVTYAGGLPLALKVLGSSLRGKTEMSFWKAKHEKLQQIPENEIHKVLRLSYDELVEETEKELFLDIVFFFVGKDRDEAVHIFRSCDFFPDIGIPTLVDRCLLTIDDSNKFQMHNLIQDMGREVIREESKHGNCRRMYLSEENECRALQNLKGADNIEGLIFDLNTWEKKYISAKVFERLPNLRLLEVIGANDIKGNFKNSFYELRCIRWYYCPWTYLPTSFRPQKLVFLDIQFNEFKMLWKNSKLTGNIKQPLANLISINMSYSTNLKETPSFKGLNMIEKLCFRGCKNLQKVHPSIGELINLNDLDMGECYDLKELPEAIGDLSKLSNLELDGCVNLKRLFERINQLTNLSSLGLGHCTNLEHLPQQLGDMKGLKKLDASYTAIEQLPDSIGQLKALLSLNLTGCTKLKKLPEQLGNMEGLKTFDASHSGIEELPDSTGQLINLVRLELTNCISLTSLPDSTWKLKLLRVLDLGFCLKLENLPEQLGKMHSLEEINARDTSIQELPDSIGQLNRLKVLDFSICKKLRYVPNNIGNLTSLERLYLPQEDIFRSDFPDMVKNMKDLEKLSLKCNIRLWLPMILSFSSLRSLELCNEGEYLTSTRWFNLSELSNLHRLALNNWGSSFPELPPSLISLILCNHEKLKEFPDLSYLGQLDRLQIWNCISLQSLPPLPLNLKLLHVIKCTSLTDVPDLSRLKNLGALWFSRCSLKSIDLKQSYLQVLPPDSSFSADLPNREIPVWFDYKSSGSTISFNIPSSALVDNFLGIALWFVYKYKNPESCCEITAVITNKTEGIREYNSTIILAGRDKVQSNVNFISRSRISMKNGDRIKISFQKPLYFSLPRKAEIPDGELKVEKCGVHVIQKTLHSLTKTYL